MNDYTSMYRDKKILITGGTGTIGQHLINHLLAENPKVIRVFSRDEYKQFEMQQQYQEYSNLRFLIGDVRDHQRISRAMEDIDYVFHLAAMKHVPACEYNPFEAVQTNVIGTQNVIQAAIENKVKRVLFTSTDKAINPTNTYGATKLTAERIISAAEYQKGPKKTIFSSVRFGNVMGSRGSVIPLFVKQILEQGRITITKPDMLRYMMTPKQAINLMLKANNLAKGGEVFVLKMPIIRIIDLADIIIQEVTKNYSIDHQIILEDIGLRLGEKMYEELMTEEEALKAIELEDMYIIEAPYGGKHNELKDKQKPYVNGYLRENVIDIETLRSWLLEEQLLF